MRPLTHAELASISGGDDIEVTLPFGTTFTTRQEANQSTTLELNFGGGVKETWNSGMFISCATFASGFRLMGMARGPNFSNLMAVLAARGCEYTYSAVTEDGD